MFNSSPKLLCYFEINPGRILPLLLLLILLLLLYLLVWQDMRPLKAGRCQYYGSGSSYVYENFYTSVSSNVRHHDMIPAVTGNDCPKYRDKKCLKEPDKRKEKLGTTAKAFESRRSFDRNVSRVVTNLVATLQTVISCFKVSCWNPKETCNMTVRSGTCYCCDLYDCAK